MRPDARPSGDRGERRGFGGGRDKPQDGGDRAAYRRAPGDADKAGAAGPGSAPMEFVSFLSFCWLLFQHESCLIKLFHNEFISFVYSQTWAQRPPSRPKKYWPLLTCSRCSEVYFYNKNSKWDPTMVVVNSGLTVLKNMLKFSLKMSQLIFFQRGGFGRGKAE